MYVCGVCVFVCTCVCGVYECVCVPIPIFAFFLLHIRVIPPSWATKCDILLNKPCISIIPHTPL